MLPKIDYSMKLASVMILNKATAIVVGEISRLM